MAGKDGTKAPNRKRARPLRYFYLNGDLHKKLHINRGADEITTWCYPTKRRVTYSYQAVKRAMEPAFTMSEASAMLNRGRDSLMQIITRGDIEAPQFTYSLNESMRKFKYMWSEKDLLAALAFYSTVHKGRPRKDGLITPMRLPSERELRAMIRQREVLYVKVGDEFRPTWEAPNI